MTLTSDLRSRASRWIADDPDPATRAELRALVARLPDDSAPDDPVLLDLADRFAAPLAFGTAGLRGLLGAGPNRMNRAVVLRTTWALARELLASVAHASARGVVVGGDARHMSRELVEDVACVLAASGLRTVLFPAPVPTPLVGFLVKTLGAAGGVVVTASHNPPAYNGYKVYWEDAAQVAAPADARIADAMERAPPARQVPRPALAVLRDRAMIVDPPEDAAAAYLRAVRSLAVHPDEGDREFPIVYTALHGVGADLAGAALAAAGFTAITRVPEQDRPDPAFPTVAFPNPEEPGAMDLAFAHGARSGAALILANDPDADRLAVAIPCQGQPSEGQGRFRQLTGNEVGVLLGHYLLTERPETKPRAVVTTIVSSPMLARIAHDLGVRCEETLTGFKWIAKRGIALERDGYEFVLGYEEALGYCIGSAVRDKDGISAAAIVAEMTAVLRARGQSIGDALAAIARRWGAFASGQTSFVREGSRGIAAIQSAVAALRHAPPSSVGGVAVVAVADYEAAVRRDLRTGAEEPITLPRSPVLTLELASGHRVIVRPSGTEPKAKVYYDVIEPVGAAESVDAAVARARGALADLDAAFRRDWRIH